MVANVPTLLLSGELDPVTPPRYGEQVARYLPHSLHLVAPGQGHNVLGRGCIPKILAEFIDTASVAGLDTGCIEQLGPMAFFTGFAGPEP